ncbi:MAG: peptidylprolyl isomerase [Pseudomonadota bacterium]
MTRQAGNAMVIKRVLRSAILGAATWMALTSVGVAQGLFEPVITVNDTVITRYELDQRARLLTLLRAPDPAEQARVALIEDRLRINEARRVGIEVTNEEIQAGMEEFAQRANLNAEQFIAAIAQAGVSMETFRDFVSAGLAWRTYVRNQFGPRAQVSDAEIDRALSQRTEGRGTVRLLLSEIIVPAEGPNAQANRALIQRLSDSITTESGFAAAARQYSAAATRGRGGRLEWLPIGQIPPALRAAVLVLEPGGVTDPIPLGPGIGIFQLRALEETDPEVPDTLALEYATILVPGGTSEAAKATAQSYRDRYDTCDDLYKPALSLPADTFERVTLAADEVPSDIAFELAKLDDNEVSTALTRQNGELLLFLMLCGRTVETAPVAEPELDENGEPVPVVDEREEVRQQLFNQRLASYADSFLQELRADAVIIESQ